MAARRVEGEETAGGKKADATRWWSISFPLGFVKSVSPAAQTEVIKAGENWGNRPPLPS